MAPNKFAHNHVASCAGLRHCVARLWQRRYELGGMNGRDKAFRRFGLFERVLYIGDNLGPFDISGCKTLPKLFLGTKPWFWSVCCVFLGPLWVMLVYWAIHHSSFSNRIVGEDL